MIQINYHKLPKFADAKDCYGSDPPKESCRVLRGRWFLISNGTLTPYDEQTDEAIESAYQKLLQRAEMESSEATPGDTETVDKPWVSMGIQRIQWLISVVYDHFSSFCSLLE